ncbi:MAG: sulfite reductase [Verrucomicrobia bacterium]|nr:sulfite reductase [Verrucomicrobiota bacterium]
MGNIDRNIINARIKDRYPLTKAGSTKQTWHITLDIAGLPIDYHPGDSIGIYAKNDPMLVAHLIEAMQSEPSALITHKRSGQELTLVEFLTHHANLSRIGSSFLRLLHERDPSPRIGSLLQPENKEDLRTFLAETDPLGLLREYAKCKLPLQELCDQFGPLLPRFYSVASSKRVQPDTLDLTVALFTWTQGDEKRYGVASHFLCHLAEIDKTPVPLFVQPAHHFRLPEDHSADIIMVGPGTGIAPFRAFMQERQHHSAKGSHWLFFGERNKNSDFFYEREWQEHPNLKIHTAFSRDQDEKIYVQHRMLENGAELYEWLKNGAHLYLCGDAQEMAKDVEKTLHQILCTHGQKSDQDAKNHLKELKKAGKFLLDVY